MPIIAIMSGAPLYEKVRVEKEEYSTNNEDWDNHSLISKLEVVVVSSKVESNEQ